MLFNLNNKLAVVTGGGSGIGRSVCTALFAQGARVVVLESDPEAAAQICSELAAGAGSIASILCDVSQEGPVKEAFEAIRRDYGKLDILVNNAGIAHVGNAETTSVDDFDRVHSVNVRGVFLCLKFGLPLLKHNDGGAIVNVASTASLSGIRDRFAYSMSKGAVLSMTKSVAADYLKYNIRCNCVCPARVHTPFVDGYLRKHYPGQEKEMFEQLSKAQPMGRMGRPEEIATLILYLCSDEAAFVTGASYAIDGGTTSLIWGAQP